MVREMIKISIAAAVALGLIFTAGCESSAMTGATIGSLAGAGIGQLAGGDTESTLIGAAVGGGIGYIVGNEDDKKQAEEQVYQLHQEMNTVTVNVHNSNGSIVAVELQKYGVGFLGPRGEYYGNLPTSEQLWPVYGF